MLRAPAGGGGLRERGGERESETGGKRRDGGEWDCSDGGEGGRKSVRKRARRVQWKRWKNPVSLQSPSPSADNYSFCFFFPFPFPLFCLYPSKWCCSCRRLPCFLLHLPPSLPPSLSPSLPYSLRLCPTEEELQWGWPFLSETDPFLLWRPALLALLLCCLPACICLHNPTLSLRLVSSLLSLSSPSPHCHPFLASLNFLLSWPHQPPR